MMIAKEKREFDFFIGSAALSRENKSESLF